MACFVKYMQKTFRVVRMKNRFADDVVEKISAAELQQQFYAAESWGHEDGSSEASGSTYGRSTYEKMCSSAVHPRGVSSDRQAKLSGVRSRLYRSRFFQINTYTINVFAKLVFQNVQDLHLSAPLQTHIFQICA